MPGRVACGLTALLAGQSPSGRKWRHCGTGGAAFRRRNVDVSGSKFRSFSLRQNASLCDRTKEKSRKRKNPGKPGFFKPKQMFGQRNGAQKRTRTSTPF